MFHVNVGAITFLERTGLVTTVHFGNSTLQVTETPEQIWGLAGEPLDS